MTPEARKYRIIEQIVAIQDEQLLSRLEAFVESFRKEGTLLDSAPPILAMAGIFDEEEAKTFESAIAESRKIDEDGW